MIPEVSCEFMQAIMSPYYLWQSGSSGLVWCQTSQTGGVFLMTTKTTTITTIPDCYATTAMGLTRRLSRCSGYFYSFL